MPVNAYEERRKDLSIAQSKLARMVRGSHNYGKQKQLIRNIHIQIADKRMDHLQKITHDISKNHALVALEDLNIQNMARSAKGTKDKPGKHVRRKSGLNRVILDQGWGTIKRLIQYKEVWRGDSGIRQPGLYQSGMRCVRPHLSGEPSVPGTVLLQEMRPYGKCR